MSLSTVNPRIEHALARRIRHSDFQNSQSGARLGVLLASSRDLHVKTDLPWVLNDLTIRTAHCRFDNVEHVVIC